jgi:hypothetical protein
MSSFISTSPYEYNRVVLKNRDIFVFYIIIIIILLSVRNEVVQIFYFSNLGICFLSSCT